MSRRADHPIDMAMAITAANVVTSEPSPLQQLLGSFSPDLSELAESNAQFLARHCDVEKAVAAAEAYAANTADTMEMPWYARAFRKTAKKYMVLIAGKRMRRLLEELRQ